MRTAILGAYSYAEFFGCALAFMPIMGASHHRHKDDPTQRLPGRWMRRFGRVASSLTPIWKFSVDGAPPADIASRAYVVVSNHESTADPFLLAHLPWDMRWVAKEEIFRLFFLGRLMRYGGDIPLRRGDKSSVTRMMDMCRETLSHGCSVMVFPEGTRSPTGQLLPFKDGAFQMAIDAGVPILPIALAGTRNCRPKGSLWFGEARGHARVLPAISTEGMTRDDVGALRDRTRDTIVAALPEVRALVGDPRSTRGSLAPTANA